MQKGGWEIQRHVTDAKAFVVRYWFWMLALSLLSIAAWIAFEAVHSDELGYRDLWPLRMYLANALLLFANLLVLWWYADSTRRQSIATEGQLSITQRQLQIAETELHNSWAVRWQDIKPMVFMDGRRFDSDTHRRFITNVGGPALNVFYMVDVSKPLAAAIPLGAIGPGEQRELTEFGLRFDDAWRHVLIAEGIRGRTRRWNATLNVGSERYSSAVHAIFDVGKDAKPGDDEHMTLEDFVTKHRAQLVVQLEAIQPPGQPVGS